MQHLFVPLLMCSTLPWLVHGGCAERNICCSKRNISCFALRDHMTTGFVSATASPSQLVSLETGRVFYPIFIPRVHLELEAEAERLRKRRLQNKLQHRQSMRWNFSSEEFGSGDRMDDWEVEEELHHWKMHTEAGTTPTPPEAAGATPLARAQRMADLMINDEIPKFIIRQDPDLWTTATEPPNRTEMCYCDEACTALSDCCWDYASACSVVDCYASQWSVWSPCEKAKDPQRITVANLDEHCGTGISRRAKMVTQSAKNGGAPCGKLEEQRACYVETEECKSTTEVANLISYKYQPTRMQGYKRKTYYEVPRLMEKYTLHQNYCSIFVVTWLNPACDSKNVTATLKVVTKVCAECQTGAYRKASDARCVGDGVQHVPTAWNVLYTGQCYGYWRKVFDTPDCDCATFYPEMPRYLFT